MASSIARSPVEDNARVVQLEVSISDASRSHVVVSHACSSHITCPRGGGTRSDHPGGSFRTHSLAMYITHDNEGGKRVNTRSVLFFTSVLQRVSCGLHICVLGTLVFPSL